MAALPSPYHQLMARKLAIFQPCVGDRIETVTSKNPHGLMKEQIGDEPNEQACFVKLLHTVEMHAPEDSGSRLVRLTVKVTDTGIVRLNGGALPQMKSGTILDISFPTAALVDAKDIAEFSGEQVVVIAQAKVWIALGISPNSSLPQGAERFPAQKLGIPAPYTFVMISLGEELRLRLQPGKRAVLLPCACEIPVLDETASSLNHAYTIVSEACETERISHTANVFTRAYIESGERWVSLDLIRKEREAAYEKNRASKSGSQGKAPG